MIEFTELVYAWLSGVLMGIIEAWNKKVMFILFVLILVASICSYIFFDVIGEPIHLEVAQTLLGIFIVAIGYYMGSIIYSSVWRKK